MNFFLKKIVEMIIRVITLTISLEQKSQLSKAKYSLIVTYLVFSDSSELQRLFINCSDQQTHELCNDQQHASERSIEPRAGRHTNSNSTTTINLGGGDAMDVVLGMPTRYVLGISIDRSVLISSIAEEQKELMYSQDVAAILVLVYLLLSRLQFPGSDGSTRNRSSCASSSCS